MHAIFLLVLGLVLWPIQDTSAQAPGSGLPFFKRAVTKAEMLVHVRNNCSQELFNVSCEEFLGAIQGVDPNAPMRVSELAVYLESLEEKLCGTGEARFSVLYPSPRSIQYNELRLFSPGEMCLFSSSTDYIAVDQGEFAEKVERAKPVLSLGCGNTVPVVLWLRPWGARDEELRIADSQISDTSRVTVPRGTTIFGSREKLVIYQRQHFTTPRPMVWEFTPVDTTSRAVAIPITIPDTVVIKKRRSWLPYAIGGAVVGGVIGYIIKKCKPSDDGGPVNPPNRLARFRVGFSF